MRLPRKYDCIYRRFSKMVRNYNSPDFVLARISYLKRVNMSFHVETTRKIRKHFFSYVNFAFFVPCIMKHLLTMIHWLVP